MDNFINTWANYKVDDDLITVTSGINGIEGMGRKVAEIHLNLQDKAVHNALAEKGLCIAPIEPTMQMLCAAQDYIGLTTVPNTVCIYKAMIKSALEK